MSLIGRRPPLSTPLALGVLTMVTLVPLLLWDVSPRLFPAAAHNVLAAVPLGLIAVAYLVHQGFRRAAPAELAKAGILAASFLFWAANQLWPGHRSATLFNDIAIAGFVFDAFLVVAQWPPSSARDGHAKSKD